MSVKAIPEGYHTVTPYLINNDVAGVIDFLNKVFAIKVIYKMENPLDGKIKHAEIQLGDSKIMLGGAKDDTQIKPGMLFIYVEDTDAIYAKAIAAGAISIMPPTNMFYGDRSGGVTDLCGNQWWIATRIENLDNDEITRRAKAQGL